MENTEPDYSPNGTIIYHKEESQFNYNTYGVLFGGEYFLGDHFSVGAEAGYSSTSGKPEDSPDDNLKAHRTEYIGFGNFSVVEFLRY